VAHHDGVNELEVGGVRQNRQSDVLTAHCLL
jgi:hypothetical protein